LDKRATSLVRCENGRKKRKRVSLDQSTLLTACGLMVRGSKEEIPHQRGKLEGGGGQHVITHLKKGKGRLNAQKTFR